MPVLPSQWKNDKVLTDEERMVFAALEMEDDQLLMHAIEEKGASLNCKDFHGNIPLHYIAVAGHKQLFKELIRRGAFVSAQDNYGWSALHYASFKGRLSIVEEILSSAVVDVNMITVRKETPLHCAAFQGHLDVVKRLLQAGADPFKEDRHQRNPYHFAKRSFDNYVPPAWIEIQQVLKEAQNRNIVVLDTRKVPQPCLVCKTPTTKKCLACKSVYYCSRQCQNQDWKQSHENQCNLKQKERKARKEAKILNGGVFSSDLKDLPQNQKDLNNSKETQTSNLSFENGLDEIESHNYNNNNNIPAILSYFGDSNFGTENGDYYYESVFSDNDDVDEEQQDSSKTSNSTNNNSKGKKGNQKHKKKGRK